MLRNRAEKVFLPIFAKAGLLNGRFHMLVDFLNLESILIHSQLPKLLVDNTVGPGVKGRQIAVLAFRLPLRSLRGQVMRRSHGNLVFVGRAAGDAAGNSNGSLSAPIEATGGLLALEKAVGAGKVDLDAGPDVPLVLGVGLALDLGQPPLLAPEAAGHPEGAAGVAEIPGDVLIGRGIGVVVAPEPSIIEFHRQNLVLHPGVPDLLHQLVQLCFVIFDFALQIPLFPSHLHQLLLLPFHPALLTMQLLPRHYHLSTQLAYLRLQLAVRLGPHLRPSPLHLTFVVPAENFQHFAYPGWDFAFEILPQHILHFLLG